MSTNEQRMSREQALPIALAWMAQISPLSTRAAIAGSLRRERPEVGDIELVGVPNIARIWDWQALLGREYIRFLTQEERQEYGWRYKHHDTRVKPTALAVTRREGRPMVIKGGFGGKTVPKYTQVALPMGICLDLFTPDPYCWALIYFIRTGSTEFTAAMATLSKQKGYIWSDGRVYRRGASDEPTGKTFALADEEDVFRFFGVRWVARTTGDIRGVMAVWRHVHYLGRGKGGVFPPRTIRLHYVLDLRALRTAPEPWIPLTSARQS